MKTSWGLLAALAGATALWTGCGDNSDRCGKGTTAMAGYCVPDSTVTCGQGTILNAQTGTCDFDPSQCAAGTVYMDGKCIPEDDALTADYNEAAEPNDATQSGDTYAGSFALPAIGTRGVIIHGCIDPYRDVDGNGNLDIDYDTWQVTTSGPALVQITADGVHGLDAGFYVQPTTQTDLTGLATPFVRFGLNLAGDTSSRTVYLPESGTWNLVMSDSRSLFLTDGAAGGPTDCYYTTVKQLAVPTPTAVAAGTPIADMMDNDTHFYKYTAASAADVIDAVHHVGPAGVQYAAANPSLLVLRNGNVAGYGVPDGFFTVDAEVTTGGLASTDDILMVADPVYNYSLGAVPFTLAVKSDTTFALPTDGSTVTVTEPADDGTLGAFSFGYVNVGADKVVHFNVDLSAPAQMILVTGDLSTAITFINWQQANVSHWDGWVRFPAAGVYYLVVYQPGSAQGDTINVTSTVDQVTPAPLVVGTPVDNAPFSADGANWYSLDTTSATWIATSASAVGFGGPIDWTSYDPAAVGGIDAEITPLDSRTYATDGSDTLGQIVYHAGGKTLVRISDTAGTATSSATFDLSVGNRNYTDLGTVTEVTPLSRTGITVTSPGGLYFVKGNPGDSMQIIVTPTNFNTSIDQLNRDESNALTVNDGGTGAAEEIDTFISADGYVAFRVNKLGGAGTTFDLAINASAPTLYTVAAGSLTYADICSDPNATVMMTGQDESLTAVNAMPFAFQLHGQPASNYYVSSNGFLSFTAPDPGGNAFYTNAPIPTAGTPDGVVAPLWADLTNIEVCKLETANSVTIQWTGVTYAASTPVEFQAIMNSDDTIDFVYGANETYDGATGTVGTESLGGTVGNQIEYNAGGVTASSSKVLTPQ